MMGGMGNRSGVIARAAVVVCAFVLSVLPGTAGASAVTAGPGDGETDAAQPAAVTAEGRERLLFRFKDPRITESSGLAVSRTHKGIVYTHNDSGEEPVFFAVGPDGRTRARFTLRGAAARDWEAMALSTDPRTGRGVLWFADIGDNLNGAWPNISIYRVEEPAVLRDATLPAVRYRFRYADGARNAEGIMVHPRTGRLYVVSKEFAGSVYIAPKKLRTDRVNVLRRVGPAPIMATDAAYSPDGSTFVIRTYISATLYSAPGKVVGRISMPPLKQAESIAYTLDGRALLTGSEGERSPLYEVPIPARLLDKVKKQDEQGKKGGAVRSDGGASAQPSPVAAAEPEPEPDGVPPRMILLWVGVAVGATAVIALIARLAR
ncbi:hypothetical protein SAMN04489764_1023 [Thermostaphylospora chromogena]|uniref:WD40-like Beta Propeller Repeat n=2 Tax=Thermostaphylospora chromogena TaxID=35622 RepID=A0A1H1BLE3_9ACTN|nr:hypothetical protein SAMN04489764_1023 [Thermostaphylospora chromogena]